MRVRQFATQHPLSARFPLRRYFVRKFKFSGELMVSYFNLMIATDLCFAITGQREAPTTTLWPSAHSAQACRWPPRHTDDRYCAVDPSLPGEYFGITGDLVPPQGPSVSPAPASRTGGRGIDLLEQGSAGGSTAR
jgi:hypothetical protein